MACSLIRVSYRVGSPGMSCWASQHDGMLGVIDFELLDRREQDGRVPRARVLARHHLSRFCRGLLRRLPGLSRALGCLRADLLFSSSRETLCEQLVAR